MSINKKETKEKFPLNHTTFITIIISLLIILSTTTTIVKADDIIVDDDGSGTYLSIQDAIDAALPGDTIWVMDGSYNDQLTISTSDIKIIADNGAEPILYLTSYSPGINIQADQIVIEGFRIYGNANPGGGPVIRLSSAADSVDIRDNEFTTITSEIGNTVLLVESGAEDGRFINNDVDDYNIGVELQGASDEVVSSNSFSNVNYTVYHGATIQGSSKWYGTIQDVIDVADTDDTITVVPGPFTENIQINKSIIFKGAQSGDNPVNGRSGEETILDGGTTSTIQIVSETNNVTIDGFTITIANKDASSNQAGILITPASNDIIIKNNIIQNITDGATPDTINDETYAIMAYGRDNVTGGQRNILIQDNLIQNVEEYGIALNDNTSSVTIRGNKIINLLAADHTSEGFPPWIPSWPDLICSAIHLGGQVGPIYDITIEDNILMTNQTGDGITTAAGSGVSFAGVPEWPPGVRPWNGFQQISIEENIISMNSRGLIALIGFSNGSIEVHNNNISGNALYAIENVVSNLHFNATDNWWGNITGPYNATDNPAGIGDSIFGNITFWPWYEFETGSIVPFVDYDVEGPQVEFGEIIRETTEIELNAFDNESGILSLTYRIWNTTHRWGPWINYTGPFQLIGQGNHRVQYNATDVAGASVYPNVDGNDYYSHRVDDVAPDVEVLYPNGGEFEYDAIPIEWEASDKIFDQGQLQYNDSIPLTEDYPGHIQSFIPTENSIDSVQILINGDDANISVKLFDSIFPVPTVIGQSMKRIQDIGTTNNPEWIDFPFSSSIDLDTSQTYYIGVTQEIYGDNGFKWHYFNNMSNDKYPYGHMWIKETDTLVNMSPMDFAFKTMYWTSDIGITIQYSNTGSAPWSTIAAGEDNDGFYSWDTATYGIPDGPNYRINIIATDDILNLKSDYSDEKFIIDNEGPSIYNVILTDTTLDNSQYTKNGDNIEISAQIGGDPEEIYADLSPLGKGTLVPPTTFTGGIAKWTVTDILCSPPNGQVTVTITAEDETGDSGMNTGTIIADNENPMITITKPRAGLYFMDSMRLLPFSYPFIIGQITFEVDANDNGSGVNEVKFYLENDLESNVSEPPYQWLWDRAATGFFDVEIVAIDNVGHIATDEITDLFIINFDVVGH